LFGAPSFQATRNIRQSRFISSNSTIRLAASAGWMMKQVADI
jgi:hypothetical protein